MERKPVESKRVRSMNRRVGLWTLAMTAALSAGAAAQSSLPRLSVGIDAAKGPQDVSVSLQILLLLTILSLAPALLIMVTSFTRIIIVLSFTRSAIGTPQVPPNSVLIGLALFLTFFTMWPIWSRVNESALQPYLRHEMSFNQAMDNGVEPVRNFMFDQVREKDIALFVNLAHINRPKTEADVPTHVLIPAFLISELRTAFSIGFLIFIPFLIIDMVISVTLMSMGMMMLPPILISLPFKILLFVLVDGWHLIVRSLTLSFK
jgi:flagellar biosynthetic protein FliP